LAARSSGISICHACSVALSPDGRLAASGCGDAVLRDGKPVPVDSAVRLWDVARGKEVHRFTGHASWINCVAFSPDGLYVLSGGGDRTVRLWELHTGVELRKFEGHAGTVYAVAFTPDGRRVVSGSGGYERTPAGAPVLKDGRPVLLDCTVRVWDVDRAREVRRFEGHTALVSSVAVSPDGRY